MKSPKQLAVAILLALLITLLVVFTAQAAQTPDLTSPWITLSAAQGAVPGSYFVVSGYSYAPNGAVVLSLGPANGALQPVDVTVVDGQGNFFFNVPVPQTAVRGEEWAVEVMENLDGNIVHTTNLHFVIGEVSSSAATPPAALYSSSQPSTYNSAASAPVYTYDTINPVVVYNVPAPAYYYAPVYDVYDYGIPGYRFNAFRRGLANRLQVDTGYVYDSAIGQYVAVYMPRNNTIFKAMRNGTTIGGYWISPRMLRQWGFR